MFFLRSYLLGALEHYLSDQRRAEGRQKRGGEVEGLSQADAAELGMSPGAVKVAVHRMRQKFGEAVRAEIADTVDNEQEVSAELRYLIEALQA